MILHLCGMKRNLVYRNAVGETMFLGTVERAAKVLGVSKSTVCGGRVRGGVIVDVGQVFAVRCGDAIELCRRDQNGRFWKIGSRPVSVEPDGKVKDVTEALYDVVGENVEAVPADARFREMDGYMVGDCGIVVSPCGKPLRMQKDGWVTVRGRRMKVDRLVAEAFIGPGWDGAVLQHRDGDPSNCSWLNLRWSGKRDGCRSVARDMADGRGRKVFRSVREAAEERGVSPSMIYQFISGRKKDSNGYIWSYESN